MIIWCTVPEILHVTDVIAIFHFGLFFALLHKNFEKLKKTSGDIIILQKCTKNHDHMCYTVPEIWHVTNVIVIFHFGLFFALLPPNSLKNQNFKKMKKHLEISSFYKCVPKIMIR